MKFSELFSGRADFASRAEICDYIRNSKNFDPNKEDPSEARALLIFSTSKQQTWLVATGWRLYCILDDIRKDAPHINWSKSRSEIVSGGRISISIHTKQKGEAHGLVDIGDRKNWYYSTRLFSRVNIETAIKDLLQQQML